MPELNADLKWCERIDKAVNYQRDWWRKFKCDRSIRYYEGFQWENQSEYKPYVVNYIFSTLKIKIPTVLFSNPVFRVTPKPTKQDFDIEISSAKARLREAALYTFVSDDENDFSDEIKQSILDAFFAFGLIEVGYSGSFIRNPKAGKPILKSDYDIYVEPDGKILREPEKIPEWERVYCKRIIPKRFIVGAYDGRNLKNANWCGYYEWLRLEDVKAEFGEKVFEFGGGRSGDFTESNLTLEEEHMLKEGDIVKVFKIWDLRKQEFLLVSPLHQKILSKPQPFDRFPLFGLKFNERFEGFFPVPEVFNWIPMQDEQNDIKEAARLHRKRFKRILLANRTKIAEQEEIDKMMSGPDGTVINVQGDVNDAVLPIPNAVMDPAAQFTLASSKQDLNEVSGTSEPQRGISNRTTATESNFIEARAQIRDAEPKIIVANWLNRIGKELLLQQQRLTLPFWIKVNVDSDGLFEEIEETQFLWEQITGENLEGGDFDVQINVTSMSPIDKEEEKRKFFEFLQILNTFPQMSLFPAIIRETADLIGYKNEKVIREFQKMAMIAMMGLMQQAGGNQQPQENQIPGNADIQAQLQNQVI